MKSWIGVLFLCAVSWVVVAQDKEDSEYDENYEFPETKAVNVNFGIGMGLDYGGLGGKLSFVPTPNVAIFGAIGYNFNGAGYNGGIIFRMAPNKKVCPYATVMYGYNAVIVTEGFQNNASKTYYGSSFGAGIELHRRDKNNFWNFELLVPIRSTEYRRDVNILKNDPNIDFTEALPITISVGYHFAL
jgi:hypothetical protein